MIDEKSREEFVTQVVSTVNKKIELLAHLLMDNNGEGSSLVQQLLSLFVIINLTSTLLVLTLGQFCCQ